MALSLLPGAIVADVVILVFYFLTRTLLIVLPAFRFTLCVIAQCWLVIEALGRVLDRTDVAAVDTAE